MLDPRWRKVWRDALLHKARTLLVVLAIAVGIAGAGTILNAWALVRRATHDGYLASNPVAATIRTDPIDSAVLAIARAVRGVRGAEARRTVLASILAGGTWQTAILYAATDFSVVRIGRLRPEAGTWPPADGEIIVERSSVAFSGVAVGQAVSVAMANHEPAPARVSGIVRDVTLAPGWMEHVIYGFTTPATLARLGGRSSLNELRIVVDDPNATQDDVRRVAYRVKDAIERSGHRVTDVEVPVPGEHIHAAQMDSLLYTQGAFGLLALAVCGFLVVNLIAAMLAGQVREIGVMKTLGADVRDLARMYLVFAAALGALASLAALPVTISLGRSYGALKGDLLNFDVSAYAIPWWAIALQLVIGALLPVIAALVPVLRGCRMPVAAALRDFGVDRSADGFAEHWSVRLGGVSRPILLSVRNAFRNRQRMTLTLLALATGGAVFLAAANLRASVIGAIDAIFSSQKFAFSVRLADPHGADSVETAVRAVSGVSAAEAWMGLRAAIVRDSATLGNAFAVTAPPAATTLLVPRVEEGRWLRPSDTLSIVVARSMQKREPTMQLGARVPLAIDGHIAVWTVIGVVDAGPVPSAFTSREIASRVLHASAASTVVVSTPLSGVASQVDLIQRVRGDLGRAGLLVSSSQLVEENRRVIEDHLLMVVDFLGVMGWVMILVGGMGLASTMSLAVLERTREIGVLRAIGARQRAILGMVQIEGLVIATASWLVALPLSVPVSAALAKVFSRVMLEVPIRFVPESTGVTRWLVMVVAISVVSCAWPAVRAMRITVRGALAFE